MLAALFASTQPIGTADHGAPVIHLVRKVERMPEAHRFVTQVMAERPKAPSVSAGQQ